MKASDIKAPNISKFKWNIGDSVWTVKRYYSESKKGFIFPVYENIVVGISIYALPDGVSYYAVEKGRLKDLEYFDSFSWQDDDETFSIVEGEAYSSKKEALEAARRWKAECAKGVK